MKTFQQFLEATEGDLRSMGASSAQVAELKRRQAERAKRGINKGFTVGDDRNKTATASAPASSSGLARRGQKALPPSGGVKSSSTPTKSSALATRPADKGAEMVRKKKPKMSKKVKAKAKPVADEKQAGQRPGTTRPKPQVTKKKRGNLLKKAAAGAAGVGAAGLGLARKVPLPKRNRAMFDGPQVSASGKDLQGNQEIRRGERK